MTAQKKLSPSASYAEGLIKRLKWLLMSPVIDDPKLMMSKTEARAESLREVVIIPMCSLYGFTFHARRFQDGVNRVMDMDEEALFYTSFMFELVKEKHNHLFNFMQDVRVEDYRE